MEKEGSLVDMEIEMEMETEMAVRREGHKGGRSDCVGKCLFGHSLFLVLAEVQVQVGRCKLRVRVRLWLVPVAKCLSILHIPPWSHSPSVILTQCHCFYFISSP
jgi:hypothetical protein